MNRLINKSMRRIAVILLAMLLLQSAAFAQQAAQQQGLEGEKPVMENVFYNVGWGSGVGALLGLAASVIEADKKTEPPNMRENIFQGMTIGGLAGLGLGLYLVYKGITFRPEASVLAAQADGNGRPGETYAQSAAYLPPFQLVSTREKPFIFTGFKAQVVGFRF